MSDNEDEQPNPPPPPLPPAQGSVKLSPFWPQAPALWFAQAECTFAVKHVTGQFDRYCHVVAALPQESLRMVADLVEAPPAARRHSLRRHQEPPRRLSSADGFPEGGEAVPDARLGQQEAVGSHGGHVGDLPQRGGEE
jgi:hypothetical protein